MAICGSINNKSLATNKIHTALTSVHLLSHSGWCHNNFHRFTCHAFFALFTLSLLFCVSTFGRERTKASARLENSLRNFSSSSPGAREDNLINIKLLISRMMRSKSFRSGVCRARWAPRWKHNKKDLRRQRLLLSARTFLYYLFVHAAEAHSKREAGR